jgi:hypothetical protein
VIAALALTAISVVAPEARDQVQQFAAAELVRYLAGVTGQKVSVGQTKAAHRILLGRAPGEAALKEDGFRIRRKGPDVIIEGAGPRGVLYGSYAYLERLGVRFYFPGAAHEVVPRRAIDWTAPLDIAESPFIRDRIVYYWPNHFLPFEDWIDFAAKMRLNRIHFCYGPPANDWYTSQRARLQGEVNKRGLMIEAGGHLLPEFLPREMFAEHPDWFPRNAAGARISTFNLNPFNHEALAYVGDRAVAYFGRIPEASLFHAWPDDIGGGGWTNEPGKQDYTPSDQSLLVMNHMVTRLREKLPEANVAFLAYHDTVDAPRVVKPAPGIVYFYAPRERCYAHSLDDASCTMNRVYARALEQALPSFGAANAEVFEYYADEVLFQNATNPPLPEVMAADARYYQRLGIPRVGSLAVSTSEFPTPMVNLFLFPKALWNPAADLNAALGEYARTYYGDSAMAEFLQLLKTGLSDLVRTCAYKNPGNDWYRVQTPQETVEAVRFRVESIERGVRGPLTRAAVIVGDALRRATNKTQRARLDREKRLLEFTALQARTYLHVFRAEHSYRLCDGGQNPRACLAAAEATGLARLRAVDAREYWRRVGFKGTPLVPEVDPIIGPRLRSLVRRGAGLHLGDLSQFLPNGVAGFTADTAWGAVAILHTETNGPVLTRGAIESGVEYRDEFGEPLGVSPLDLSGRPVVVEARGLNQQRLISRILRGLE